MEDKTPTTNEGTSNAETPDVEFVSFEKFKDLVSSLETPTTNEGASNVEFVSFEKFEDLVSALINVFGDDADRPEEITREDEAAYIVVHCQMCAMCAEKFKESLAKVMDKADRDIAEGKAPSSVIERKPMGITI